MDKHLLEVLDFYKIKEFIDKELYTFSGKQLLKNLEPSSELSLVDQWQRETTEMKNILEGIEGGFLFTPMENDIVEDIKLAQIHDNVLSASTLLYIVRILECSHRAKDFFERLPENEFPLIREKISEIKYFRMLEKSIKNCIDDEAEIVDNASPLLKKIRQGIRSTEKRIRDQLGSILKNPQYRTFVQDDIITIRQGRYVIPIKQQERSKFPGIVHDKSESGLTAFIEPLAIVELNNELRGFFQEEKKEEYKILQMLTAIVGANGNDILLNYEYLGQLDLLNAKAKISINMKAIQPRLSTNGIIRLFQARHPLLKDNAVPIDIELGEDFDCLIITGPNTGGKTVTLKTVGLLNLMAQAGFHIPAAADSEIFVFQKIFADIGDEQSIEQNLSTFSAHMKNIISILSEADRYTLVLIDELGSGTDPSEGSALGMAIIDFLRRKGTKILGTTHHDSLKAYAYLTEGVMNARMDFNEKTLQPTYKVLIGLPGKSCAFSIAKSLGLPETILKDAEAYLEREKIDFENLINRIEKDRVQIAEKLKTISHKEYIINNLKIEIEEKMNALEKESYRIKQEAYQEAERIVDSAKERTKKIINNIKKKRYDNENPIEEIDSLDNIKEEIKIQVKKYDLTKERIGHFQEGDNIILKSMQKEGVILEKNEKRQQYLVQIGNIKLRVSNKDILKKPKAEIVLKANEEMNTSEQNLLIKEDNVTKKAHFKNEIDIRHMSTIDANIKLEKYLDDALLLNISPVYIIHGKGKGILRKSVAQLLNNLEYVKNYRYGEAYEGGDGVTVVYF